MPVVLVHTPPHAALAALLQATADTVGETLGLGPGDVVATHVPTGGSTTSARPAPVGVWTTATWPVLCLLGGPREASTMDAARRAAERAVIRWCEENDVTPGGVWVQRLTRTP